MFLRVIRSRRIRFPRASLIHLIAVSTAASYATLKVSANDAISGIDNADFSSKLVNIPQHNPDDLSDITSSVLETIENAISWFLSLIRNTFRCGFLLLTFTPAAATVPCTLLLPNEVFIEWWWSLFRSCICRAGPSFIKFAQWAAMRPDLFDANICKELSKLHSGVNPHSWEQTQTTLRQGLGEGWEEVLDIREDSMIGSGCVAQVYRGRIIEHKNPATDSMEPENTRGRSREVAVKILHPGIRESMQVDLNLMRSVAQALEWSGQWVLWLFYPNTKNTDNSINGSSSGSSNLQSTILSPSTTATVASYPLRCVSLLESVEEFAAFMQSQLDLRAEAAALQRLGQQFSGSQWAKRIVVPQPVRLNRHETSGEGANTDVTPHADVLVETYEPGVSMIKVINSIDVPAAASRESADVSTANSAASTVAVWREHDKEIAALGLDAILKMLFEDNFVHADLHAGNLLVRYPTSSDSSGGSNNSGISSSDITMSPCSAPALRQPQLVLLDAGLTVELRPADRRNFIRLFQAVIENKGAEVARLMMEYSPHRNTTTTVYSDATSTIAAATIDTLQTQQQQQLDMNIMFPTVIRPDEYAQEMSKLVNTVHKQGLTLGKISVSELLRSVLHLSYEHNVKLESRFVSVIVAIMLAEGMGRRLNPDIDILTRAKPFIRQAAVINIHKIV